MTVVGRERVLAYGATKLTLAWRAKFAVAAYGDTTSMRTIAQERILVTGSYGAGRLAPDGVMKTNSLPAACLAARLPRRHSRSLIAR